MSPKHEIPEQFWHRDWRADVPDEIISTGLEPTKSLTNWAVQLEFNRGGLHSYGSGFFINIPDINVDVILTAAHNLINEKGSHSTDMEITTSDSTVPIIPKDSDIHISRAYLVDQTPPADWGAILVQPNSNSLRSKLDLCIKLSYESLKGEVRVTGYRARTGNQVEAPVTSSGRCIGCSDKQLKYLARTERGISGSAVYMEYEGRYTAVAIHNNGPQDLDGHERRGSRITLDLLREVFDWVSAGYRDVRVRAQGKDIATTFPRGLFLNFQEDFPFARVMLGDGTKLDVLPAHVTEKQKMYAIRVGKKWAVFNADGEVVLTEHLKDACLFEMMPANKKRKSARIVAVLDYDSIKYQLRMEGTMFSKSAGVGAQSSEVSMVRYPNDPKIQYTEFSLE